MGCALQSAAHLTDYYVDVGTALMLGGSRTEDLVRMCRKAKLITEERVDGIRMYKILDDPEFLHILSKAEVEWGRQQRNDTRDPAIKVPVVRRDGDNCRYCGVLTQWRGKRSARTWTMDHRSPGEAGTVDTVVVACWRCNSSRQDNPQWDDDHPLRPAPVRPLYGRWAAEYLTENGYPTTQNVLHEERPAPASGADPAPQRVRPATTPSDAPALDSEVSSKSTSQSQASDDVTSRAGSGRDGSGSGSPRVGSALAGTPPAPGPARRRRGRRGGRPQNRSARGDS